MDKAYKLYHRYIAGNSSVSNTTVTYQEQTGSGALPNLTEKVIPNYQLSEKSPREIEEIFKEKYPLQYLVLRRKFEKKMRKLLKAIEDESS
jgi:hypothetical protein